MPPAADTLQAPVTLETTTPAWSDEELDAALWAAGLRLGGPGGDGPGGAGGGDWGGGGDGEGDDGEWTRRQFSRSVQVLALLTAGLLVLGSTGAWVSLALDASHPAFPATVVGTEPAPGGGELVQVQVGNTTAAAGTAACAVQMEAGGRLTTVSLLVDHLAPGGEAVRSVALPLPSRDAGPSPSVAAGCMPN